MGGVSSSAERANLAVVDRRIAMALEGRDRARGSVDQVANGVASVRLAGQLLPAATGGWPVRAGDVVEVERPRGLAGALRVVAIVQRSLVDVPAPVDGDQDGVLTVADDLSLAWRGPAAEAFPVGALFLSVVATDPAEMLGYGTWERIAGGRVLVGQDDEDPDFDTAEETGGAKTVAAAGTNATEDAHSHETPIMPNGTASIRRAGTSVFGTGSTLTGAAEAAASSTSGTGPAMLTGPGSAHGHAFTGSATSVVQPYLVVYVWKRTA